MAGGALQISAVTHGSPSVLKSRGEFIQCSNINVQERALVLCVDYAKLLSIWFTLCLCCLYLLVLFAANNIVSSVSNEMFPTTSKVGRRRKKLYKMETSSPLLDSPLAVRNFNMSTDSMCWHLSCQMIHLFIYLFIVICRSWGGERKWSFYHQEAAAVHDLQEMTSALDRVSSQILFFFFF